MLGHQQILRAVRGLSLIRNQCRSITRTRIYHNIQMHPTTKFDKRVLVFTKFYPSVDEVPNVVTFQRIKKAYDLARVKVSLMLMVFAVFACMFGVYLGKRRLARGDTVSKRMDEWHEEMAERGRQKRAAAAAAAAAAAKDDK